MGLSRRNALIGIGTVAAGAGVISVSGAFDQVEADRSFEVEVEGDAGALLAIDVIDEVLAEFEEGGAGDNDVIAFRLDDGETASDAPAINEAAVTSFFEVFSVTNNGSQDIELTIEHEIDGLYFEESEDGDDLAEGVDIDQGNSINVDIRINTEDTEEGGYTEPDGEPYQITLIALSDDAQ